MKIVRLLCFSAIALFALGTSISAQETETKVVDEVVAQVNDGVITLSRINREKKAIIDSYIHDGKSKEEAEKMVNEKEGEMIASLVNEELLVQKAKELGIDSEVDASINARFLEIMKQNNIKTIDALNQMMESQGIDPTELKDNWRKQITREQVLQREVQSKIYWGFSGKELKDYFEKNKSKFVKPDTISFSEIYYAFAGKDEETVRAKAKGSYEALVKGGDFNTIAKDSDKGIVTYGAGKAENVSVPSLVDKIADPLKGLKVGEYTKPFEIEDMGIVILRVDNRTSGGGEAAFDEEAVRLAMLNEQAPDRQKKFMSDLRADAYIKISDSYRPLVNPILFADERQAKPAK